MFIVQFRMSEKNSGRTTDVAFRVPGSTELDEIVYRAGHLLAAAPGGEPWKIDVITLRPQYWETQWLAPPWADFQPGDKRLTDAFETGSVLAPLKSSRGR